MNFLDFIFDNLFIVAIVVFGIINLFSRSTKSNQTEQQQKQSRPTNNGPPKQQTSRTNRSQKEETSPSSQRQGPILGRMAEKVENALDEITNQYEQTTPNETVAEQQKKQYDQLKKEVQHEYAANTDEKNNKVFKQTEHLRKTTKGSSHEVTDIDVKSLTNRKGLVQGMIMSEVLGPPRGLKPYRSIINERRN